MFEKLFKKKTALPVKEFIETVMSMINNHFSNDGWSCLKSSRKLKKTIGILDFEVYFFSSKWNQMNKRIEIEYSAHVFCRTYKRPHNQVLSFKYKPLNKELIMPDRRTSYDYPYYNIIYKENFVRVVEDIIYQLSQTIVLLAHEFENDFKSTGI